MRTCSAMPLSAHMLLPNKESNSGTRAPARTGFSSVLLIAFLLLFGHDSRPLRIKSQDCSNVIPRVPAKRCASCALRWDRRLSDCQVRRGEVCAAIPGYHC